MLLRDMRVILMHGNGFSTPEDNWLPYVKRVLESKGLHVLAPQFPDAPLMREKYWMPFLEQELCADKSTVLIGHSTGAIAALRYAEKHKILGSVLVAGYVTDLGIESEKLSGYFDRPWDWQALQNNQSFIIQFASSDDPWIPIEEARALAHYAQTDYHEFSHEGHFGGDRYKPEFPELIELLVKKLEVT